MAVIRFRQTHYTPEDDVKGLVDGLPDHATKSVDVEIYGLTDIVLVNGLIQAHRRGVRVRVMNDRTQSAGPRDHEALQMLVDAGVTVKVVESVHGAIDHLKNIIIDADDGPLADTSSVLYGSYNFSAASQKQDNLACWTNDPGEVEQAIKKFELDWDRNRQEESWQIRPSHP